MRILFVTPYAPSPIRVRPYNFLKQLSRHNEVTLVSLACGDPSEDQHLDEMRDCCASVHVMHLGKLRAYLNCAKHLFTTTPLQAAYTHFPECERVIKRLAEENSCDLVHVEHIRGAHLVRGIDRLPKIYDSVDCITRLLRQRLENGGAGFASRTLDREELLKMHSYEARTAAAFDRVIITSEQDKKSLEELITQSDHLDTPISVIRNGVDSDYFKPIDGLPEDIELVFSGKMSYSPNVSAILGFYRDVFPIVRAALPGARLKIVGSSPTEPVLRLANDPNVTVTGYVPDIRPHLASAKVVICPLTIGVGIQNKVLEAMAMGKAVMSTALSFQGIPEAVDGRHMLIADDPEDMANGILKLIDDRARARVLGKNALSLVRESYSWEASTRQLESLYGGAIESAKYRAHAAP